MADPAAGSLTGRRAVVTGGSRGIGLAIAGRLARGGAEVLLVSGSGAGLEDAARELGAGAWFQRADVGHPADVERLLVAIDERWGGADILVNNAGTWDEAAFTEIDPDRWDRVLAVMLTGPFLLTRRLGRAMAVQGRGAIVNVASIDGHAAERGFASYDVAKAALIMLTRAVAVDLGPSGVRCNSVSPGYTRTDMVERSTPPNLLGRMSGDFTRVPLRRLLDPDEVAAACCFLASDEASGITGADLVVDGGLLADLHVLPTLA
jgi:NAD(P)-dependent dehydrogenase (short-subunit alcohol dehydrogenase family)